MDDGLSLSLNKRASSTSDRDNIDNKLLPLQWTTTYKWDEGFNFAG